MKHTALIVCVVIISTMQASDEIQDRLNAAHQQAQMVLQAQIIGLKQQLRDIQIQIANGHSTATFVAEEKRVSKALADIYEELECGWIL